MFDFTTSFWVDWLILGVLFLVILYLFGLYRSLKRLGRDVHECFSVMEGLLKQRHNEIPKLVVAVQKNLQHEQHLFTRLAKARHLVAESAIGPENVADLSHAESHLQNTLEQLRLLVEERMPESHANESVELMHKEFQKLEMAIVNRRNSYNRCVHHHNMVLERFPDEFFAKLFKFSPYEVLQLKTVTSEDHQLDELFQKYKHGVVNV